MDIDTIDGSTGKVIYSPNKRFVVLRQYPGSPAKQGKIILATTDKQILFTRYINYPEYFDVSDNGNVIVCNHENENPEFFSQIAIFDNEGDQLFLKQSLCPVTAVTINSKGTVAAVAFAGAEKYFESYTIVMIDIQSETVFQLKPIPNNTSAFSMSFDGQSSLKVNGL